MLKVNKKVETTVETEIALDECGGHVMLSLRYGGDKFCQALTAQDMGKLLSIVIPFKSPQVVLCEGDLVVQRTKPYYRDGVEFVWHAEGHECKVVLEETDTIAFEWACRSYCKQLFRTNKGV
jgi:hypothetical protein